MSSSAQLRFLQLVIVVLAVSGCTLFPSPGQPTPPPPAPPAPAPAPTPPTSGPLECPKGLIRGLGEIHRIEADGPIVLGTGYSVATGVPRATAIDVEPAEEPTEYSIEYTIDFAETTKDLAKSLGVKASASGSWGTGSASGKASLLRQSRSHQYSAYLIVKAKAVSKVEVANVSGFRDSALNDLGKAAELFYATYGDSYVYRRAWGAELTAVLSVEAKKFESKEELSVSLRVAAGTFKAAASVKSSLTQALENRRVKVVYSQRGGGPGRPVCLDSTPGSNCEAWPGDDKNNPSRGGVVALTPEQLILRLRDFSQEIENDKNAARSSAQLIYFDVLDYGSVPGRLCFVDPVDRERVMEDLGEILLTLEDQLETIQFAVNNADPKPASSSAETKPTNETAGKLKSREGAEEKEPVELRVSITDDLDGQLERLEWLHRRGIREVKECLEDRSRSVSSCLQQARDRYINLLPGANEKPAGQQCNRQAPIHPCAIYDEGKLADFANLSPQEREGIFPAVRIADSFNECAKHLTERWTVKPGLEEDEVTLATERPAAAASAPAEHLPTILPTVGVPSSEVPELVSYLTNPALNARSLRQLESAVQDLISVPCCQKELDDLIEPENSNEPARSEFVSCLLENPLILKKQEKPLATCEDKDIKVLTSAEVTVGKKKKRKAAVYIADVDRNFLTDEKNITVCSKRVFVRAAGAATPTTYLLPVPPNDKWVIGELKVFPVGKNTWTLGLEATNLQRSNRLYVTAEVTYVENPQPGESVK